MTSCEVQSALVLIKLNPKSKGPLGLIDAHDHPQADIQSLDEAVVLYPKNLPLAPA